VAAELYPRAPYEVIKDEPVVVGDEPLRDDDDDTYAEVRSRDASPKSDNWDREDALHIGMDTLTTSISATAPIIVNYRMTATTTDDWAKIGDHFFYLHNADHSVALALHPFPEADRPANSGAPQDRSFEVSDDLLADWGITRQHLLDGLAAGLFLDFAAWRVGDLEGEKNSAETVLRLHKFWLSFGTSPRRLPHNRILQRGNDGLGITGGRRILGTKTLQSSNRATGIR
jgi:hypothetical protein